MFFSFMFYVPYLMILNLVVVSKINLQWGCLLTFYIPCKQFKLEKSLTEKLKSSTSVECLEYFDSKNMWFYDCENKPYIVATIIKK